MVETVAKPLCAKLLLLMWIPHSFSWTSFTCNIIFTKSVFTSSFFCEGNALRQKKFTYSEISWKIKLRSRWVFFSILFFFCYDSSYLGQKKVQGYLISFEPQMVRSSFKGHLSKLKYRFSYDWLFESYMSVSF